MLGFSVLITFSSGCSTGVRGLFPHCVYFAPLEFILGSFLTVSYAYLVESCQLLRPCKQYPSRFDLNLLLPLCEIDPVTGTYWTFRPRSPPWVKPSPIPTFNLGPDMDCADLWLSNFIPILLLTDNFCSPIYLQ